MAPTVTTMIWMVALVAKLRTWPSLLESYRKKSTGTPAYML